METIITTILCLASFVISFFGVAQGVVLLVRLLTFTQPFSKKLTEHRVYDLSVHGRLIRTEWAEHIIFLAITLALSVLLMTFGELPCAIVLITGFALRLIYSLVISKAAIGITTENVNAFRKAHGALVNMERFEHYVRRL